MRRRFIAQSTTHTTNGHPPLFDPSSKATDYRSRTAAGEHSRSHRVNRHLEDHLSESLNETTFDHMLWQRFGMTCRSMASGQTSRLHFESSCDTAVQPSCCRRFMCFDEITTANHAFQ